MMIGEKLLAFTLLGAGWVLWLLIGLSVLSVTVLLERAVYFFRRRTAESYPQMLALAQAGELDEAAAVGTPEAMETSVMRAAASAANGGTAAVQEAIASAVERRRMDYEKWLFILGTLGNNAPFIGLFGTVLGIIRAFADLALANKAAAGAAATVMSGISEALVATAVGLFVALPAVLGFNVLQRIVKNAVGRSNALGHAALAGLHHAEATKEVE